MGLQDHQLTRSIEERVHEVPAPMPDLAVVRQRGRAYRRRRTAGVAAAVGMTAAAGGGALAIGLSADSTTPAPTDPQPISGLDYSEGLRAFASPDEGGEVSLGGRVLTREDLGEVDTEGTATPFGLLYYDSDRQVHLLQEDGTDATLAPAPSSVPDAFRGTSKADSQLPVVAFTQPGEGQVSVLLHDFEAGRTLHTRDVPCDGQACSEVAVDAVDGGFVFVRTQEGTYVWDPEARGDAGWTLLGTGEFRVADARNGRILWSGAPPSPGADSPVKDWAFTEGAIDSQLSFDGGHVLAWSPKLEPTAPAGAPIRLDVEGAIFFTFDTDGSVLAAGQGKGQTSVFYDCELPSGACAEIGSLSSTSGDPIFIGNDM
jgi:hypothetical protein